MTDYKPGTVAKATVRGQEDVLIVRCNAAAYHWVSTEIAGDRRTHLDAHITDVRPLVLLDLEEAGSHLHPNEMARGGVVTMLRDTGSRVARNIADQIEAQTKPPRIPEPGLWGVVEAVNGDAGGKRTWVRWPENSAGNGWVSDTGYWRCWSDLIDPTPVREGVES